jgi:hypothetical protein
MSSENPNRRIKIRPYKLQELADIYNVNRNTFRRWLKRFENELGEREGYFYSIPQVRIIFKKLCLPSYVEVEPD